MIVWFLGLVVALSGLVAMVWALWHTMSDDVELASVDEFSDFRSALGGGA